MTLRIHVDFNALTEDGKRVQINKDFYADLLDQLRPDTRVICYEPDDLEVEGVIEIDHDQDGTQWWLARLDWPTLRYLV